MDSTEFSYAPQTITSAGSKVLLGKTISITDAIYHYISITDTIYHSICPSKNFFLVHTFEKDSLQHRIRYVDQPKLTDKVITIDVPLRTYDYAFLLDENKIIYYGNRFISLFQNGKSRKLFESSDPIYFRLDDSKNIIILHHDKAPSRISREEDGVHIHFKITILKKENNYKPADCGKYSIPGYRINANFHNLLFVTELNECILNYYKNCQDYYIVLVQYNAKNNYYDLLIYRTRSEAHVDRWTQKSPNNWLRTVIIPVTDADNFCRFNQHFNRRIITNYCTPKYNFGSIVSEIYSDWQKRMLEILSNAIEKLSADLLKLILSMCADNPVSP